MPVKMTPLEPAARDAILVGDPRRAFALAQELTEQPKMSHQARGLWGYRGTAADGIPLTVQSTGSGGPSAVPVIGDLASQGVNRILRLGTCLAIDPDLPAGSVVLVERALVADGTSRALGNSDFVLPDPGMLAALDGIGKAATVSSHDLVARYEPGDAGTPEPGEAIARDLQTAATLAMGRKLEIQAAAILIVAEDHHGHRPGEEELWNLFRSVGRQALEKLARVGTPKTDPTG